VSVQQGQAVFYASCRNQRVDGFADRDAFGSKNAVVLGRLQGQVVSAKVEVGECVEDLLHQFELFFITNALQNFHRNQVANGDGGAAEQGVKQRNLGRVGSAEALRRDAALSASHEVTDRKEEASVLQSAELDGAQEARDLDEIAQVEAALLRLSTGRYGQCVDCGDPIVLPRLLVQPAAQRCALCQLVKERAELRSR
jgi:DnaK suppressor protein